MKPFPLLAIVVFVLFSTLSLYAQQTFIGVKEGNRDLRWSDFTGKPDASNPFFAYTIWNINWKMNGVQFKGDTAFFNVLSLTTSFSENSWVKAGKETLELLAHEQGHFTLGRLAMLEALQTINSNIFFRNSFQEKLRSIVGGTIEKYKALSVKYDMETDHSKNKEQQQKWNTFIKAQLQQYEP